MRNFVSLLKFDEFPEEKNGSGFFDAGLAKDSAGPWPILVAKSLNPERPYAEGLSQFPRIIAA